MLTTVGTYYDELGVSPGATTAELRRAYRARARQVHPDMRGDPEAMRRLNEAWRVLSDAEARRRYDRQLGVGEDRLPPTQGAWPGVDDEDGDGVLAHHVPRSTRPVLLAAVLAVLAAIFVATAYAGGPRDPGARASPVGRCLDRQPGVDAFVSCRQPNDGEVVADVDHPDDCEPPTRPHRVLGRAQVVCLDVR